VTSLFRPAIVLLLILTALTGIAYPLLVTGLAQVAFPAQAGGSLLIREGKPVGSSLIGQDFKGDRRYFQSRPSQSGYAAGATYFGNLGPNSVAAREEVRENIASYLALEKPYDHGLDSSQIPVDAVTQSASGVDPQISQANAWIQAHRIAAVRHLSLAKVDSLIADQTQGRFLGLFGEPGVNVLQLNIALDREAPLK